MSPLSVKYHYASIVLLHREMIVPLPVKLLVFLWSAIRCVHGSVNEILYILPDAITLFVSDSRNRVIIQCNAIQINKYALCPTKCTTVHFCMINYIVKSKEKEISNALWETRWNLTNICVATFCLKKQFHDADAKEKIRIIYMYNLYNNHLFY